MTNRQRFLAAFEGKAQQVPVWEQAFASDVASELLGREAFTGSTYLHYQQAVASLRGEDEYSAFLAQVDEDNRDLARLLGWGALSPTWLMGRPSKQVGEYDFLYGDDKGWWTLYRFDPTAKTYGPVAYSHRPEWRGEAALEGTVKGWQRLAESFLEEGKEGFEEGIKRWLAFCGEEFEPVCGMAMLSIPLDQEWLTACAVAPDLVEALIEAEYQLGLQQLEAAAALGVRIAWGGGDLADNKGPTYGPKLFDRIVGPRYRGLADKAREHGMVYCFRSDGNLWPVADTLFGGQGVEGYGEIDHDAGMTIPELQQRFPRLTCWGNVSCAVLRNGSAQQVADAAGELVERCAPHGRLILGSSNTVLPGTPVENVLAMTEAAQATWK